MLINNLTVSQLQEKRKPGGGSIVSPVSSHVQNNMPVGLIGDSKLPRGVNMCVIGPTIECVGKKNHIIL